MKKSFFLLSVLAALSLTGCGGKNDAASDPNVLVDSNFDTIAGWIPEPQNATISRAQAHSGHYSLMVDGSHEYSLGYRALLGQLHSTRIKKIKVTAWAFISAPGAKAALVSAIGNPAAPNDKPLVWEAIDLGGDTAVGKWVEVSKVINIPDSVVPSNSLGFYLWRTEGNQPVYVDDLHVTVEP